MADNKVLKRRVFYISGFDPRGAGHYHRLYKQHARLQAEINGMSVNVSGRRRLSDEAHAWDVKVFDKGAVAETVVEFLSWDDIIREQWRNDVVSVSRDLWTFLRAYIASGLVLDFAKVSRQQLVAGLYPMFYIFITLAGALTVALMMGQLWGILGGAALLWAAMWLGEKLAVFWLLRIYAFSARWAQGSATRIDDRIKSFAARIVAADDCDEVMLVSHSVGTMLAVPVAAEALRRVPSMKISMVTMGQCIPLVSFHAAADAFRADLDFVANHPRVFWADYTAPSDGICFPRMNFVTASGVRLQGAPPRFLSPRFHALYTPENYRRLRFNWYKKHFLYLSSTDYRGDYDYFAITAGTQPLAVRIGEV